MLETNYSAEDIHVLEGLEAVRKRPGMYIGTTGNKGLHHILWEIIDNGIDEIANGYGDCVTVELLSDGVARVTDNGRGIPVDLHPKLKISGVEVVFTQLHAGAKFDNANYSFSGGLHGVGSAVTNALSEWLNVEVKRGGNLYRVEFHSPEIDGHVKSGIIKTPLTQIGTAEDTGTVVTFKPDSRIFGDGKFSFNVISSRLREIAYLNKGIKLVFRDARIEGQVREETYNFEGGLSDYVEYLNEGRTTVYEKPIYVEAKEDKFEVIVAIQHSDNYNESIYSYVNNIPTDEGGTHEMGFKSAFTKVFNDYARREGFLKDKSPNLLGEDFREGMVAVLAVKMQNVQFEGQTKTKLGNPDVKPKVESLLSAKFEEWISAPRNKVSANAIIAKAQGAAKTREAAKRAKDIARQKNSLNNANLIGKLASCTGRKYEINELFIVEGDSAGGSAKQARDRNFQAILPLRGKPLNIEKSTLERILANDELATIISALGTGIDDEFDLNHLKYDKVIILADADQDGAHIRALLLTFFFRYMRDLIKDGHVYVGMPPLYRLQKNGEFKYCYDEKALEEGRKIMGKSAILQRFKGLGEMNPEQLWETTMNPKSRALTRVTLEDAAIADKRITILMGDDSNIRKKYIYEYADFNKVDDFNA